jgi:hypothetical protein
MLKKYHSQNENLSTQKKSLQAEPKFTTTVNPSEPEQKSTTARNPPLLEIRHCKKFAYSKT